MASGPSLSGYRNMDSTSTSMNTLAPKKKPRPRYVIGIRVAAILHLIGGGLLVFFGICAAVFLSYWSRFGLAIWSGLAFFSINGMIGISVSYSHKRSAMFVHLGLSIFSSLLAFSFFILYCFAARGENYNVPHPDETCQPGSWDTMWHCYMSATTRTLFDGLIALLFAWETIVSIISASYVICFTSTCCYSSCAFCCGNVCDPYSTMEQATARTRDSGFSNAISSGQIQSNNYYGPPQGGFQGSAHAQPAFDVQQMPTQPNAPHRYLVPVQQHVYTKGENAPTPGQQASQGAPDLSQHHL